MYTVGEGLDPPYQYATMLLREGQDPPLQEIYQICHSEEAGMADVGMTISGRVKDPPLRLCDGFCFGQFSGIHGLDALRRILQEQGAAGQQHDPDIH